MTLRDLTLADALEVCADMRPEDAACVRAVSGSEPGEWFAVDRWRTDGPAWTLLQGGQPWAIGGLSWQSRWCGVLWMVARPGLSGQSWRKLIRTARTVIAVSSTPGEQYRHRIEAHVLAGWGGAERFAAGLGLELEGTRRAAGCRGEDVQTWVRIGPVRG